MALERRKQRPIQTQRCFIGRKDDKDLESCGPILLTMKTYNGKKVTNAWRDTLGMKKYVWFEMAPGTGCYQTETVEHKLVRALGKKPVFGGGKQALTAIHFLTAPIAMLHHQEHLPVAFGRNHMTLRDGECEYAAYGNVESEINSEQLQEATFNDNNKIMQSFVK